MKNIVTIQNHEAMVSASDIARYSQNDIESVKRLIRNKREDLEQFGLLGLYKDSDLKSVG